MIKNKSCAIIALTCLIVGISSGIGGVFFYQNNQTKDLEKNITIETIEGEYGDIFHTDLINKKETIEFKTVSKKSGKIKTVIRKKDFCPKILKNSLSVIVYGGLKDLQPNVSYGLEYRRQVFSKFHVLTGLKVDTNVYRVNGLQVFLGAGYNF